MTKTEMANSDLADEIYTAIDVVDWDYERQRLIGLGHSDIAGNIKLAVMSFKMALKKLNTLK